MCSKISAACSWINDNIPAIFTKHLPKTNGFKPYLQALVPMRLDKANPAPTVAKYAKVLKTNYQPSMATTQTTNSMPTIPTKMTTTIHI